MKLLHLSAHNFMPYKGDLVLDFPTDAYRNVMIVFGDNMRGKTSLLNALRWGFYGIAIGRHSRSIPLHELVNKEAALGGDWRLEVAVQFESSGAQYDLRRSAAPKPHIGIPTRPDDFLVSVHLQRDGTTISGDQIELEIDQVAPEQISRFFLFDGELLEEYESLLIEGSEQGRQIKEAIEKALGVPALVNGRAELGSILKQATKTQTNELAQFAGLQRQADKQRELTTKQDALERDLGELQTAFDDRHKERVKLDDELDAAAAVLSMKARLDGLKTQQSDLVIAIKEKTRERLELISEAWRDVLDAKLEVRRRTLLEKQARLTQATRDQGRIDTKIENLKRLLATETCPVCGQKMEEGHRHSLGSQLAELEVELSKAADTTSELQEISAQLSSMNKIRGVQARARLGGIEKDLLASEVSLQRVENSIAEINDQVAQHDTAELARKRVHKDNALKEEGRLQNDILRVRRDIDGIKSELAVIQKSIQGMTGVRSSRTMAKVRVTEELERTFGASIDRLRDKLREKVGTLANEAFLQMTSQKSYRGLEINSSYGLNIIDGNGRKVPLRSAGAEQIVALSLIDGLNRTGRTTGPIVMDTPFGRLDLQHRENILSYLPSVTSQFVLLVHSGEVRPETDLAGIRARIGSAYRIVEVSPTHSKIERTTV